MSLPVRRGVRASAKTSPLQQPLFRTTTCRTFFLSPCHRRHQKTRQEPRTLLKKTLYGDKAAYKVVEWRGDDTYMARIARPEPDWMYGQQNE